MDKRTEEILFGQACNQTNDALLSKGLDPNSVEFWREYELLVETYFKRLKDLNLARNKPKTSKEGADKPNYPTKPCPKCSKPIGVTWKWHGCGWKADE